MLRREYFINNPFTIPNIDIHTDNKSILHKIIAALHYFMRSTERRADLQVYNLQKSKAKFCKMR
jgi:hypothetical protein